MEIQNKTARPLAIPLPGGKKLRLGPHRIGQITPKAAEHPAVGKLVEAGEVELLNGPGKAKGPSGSSGGLGGSQRKSGGGGVRHTGDR